MVLGEHVSLPRPAVRYPWSAPSWLQPPCRHLVQAKWRFSSILKLPWRPRLAAAGATTYVFDAQTGLVIKHVEEWDVEAQKVIQQLLKPAGKPTNDWERFMDSLARGAFVNARKKLVCAMIFVPSFA